MYGEGTRGASVRRVASAKVGTPNSMVGKSKLFDEGCLRRGGWAHLGASLSKTRRGGRSGDG